MESSLNKKDEASSSTLFNRLIGGSPLWDSALSSGVNEVLDNLPKLKPKLLGPAESEPAGFFFENPNLTTTQRLAHYKKKTKP